LNPLQLNSNQTNRLFPFHFVIDQELRIRAAGKSLLKLLPECIGISFTDCFHLARPQLSSISFQEFSQLNELLIIESNGPEPFVLRGQFEAIDNNTALFFAGTPWFNSMDEVKARKLSLNDFAINDPMIDLLHVLRTEAIVSNDVKELLEQVNKQKNEAHTMAQRLSSLITNLQSGILLEDENRRIVLTNKTFCSLFGIPVDPAMMVGMDCSDSAEQSKHLFKDPWSFVRNINRLLRERKQVTGEILELTDGRFFQRDYIPMFVDDVYRGHLWQYTDISERIRQQNLLRKSEEKYRGIITNINLGLLEVDLEERIQYVNQSFRSISGYNELELLGRKPTELFQLDETFLKLMKEKNASRLEGVSDVYEVPVKIKGGIKKWWAISGAPLYNDEGQIVGSIGIHLDITRQKNLEEELRRAKNLAEQSAAAKESFLANMSHEIRTPLSGIYGMLQLLQNTRLSREQESYALAIDKAIGNLQAIINDILDLSKINAGMVEIEQVEFSLREELRSLYQLHLPKAKAKGLELVFDYDLALPDYFTGDPHRISQVINNLIGNALKFTEDGSVTVKTFPGTTTGTVVIEVTDTGIGMDAKFLEVIFEKFTQEESGHSRKFGGTGLGMSITRKLMSLMGGTIEIESEKFKGTTVRLSIPLQTAKATIAATEKTPFSGKLKGKKILVAEDNEINATVIQSMLNREGAMVTLVGNGQELTEAFSTGNFDLIISDLQMPVMGGLDAARWVRKNSDTDIWMVALTANAMTEEKERCFNAGFNTVVFKPFHREDLLAACDPEFTVNAQTEKGQKSGETAVLFDLSDLTEMVDQDMVQVRKLVEQFLQETPAKLDLMLEQLRKKDKPALKKTVHYLSSSIHHMGILSAYETVKDIEQDAFQRSPKKLEQAVLFLDNTLRKVIAQLQQEYQFPA